LREIKTICKIHSELSISHMTPEQLVARKKKLASAARALITGELGLVRASNHIRRTLDSLGPEKPDSFPIFDQFYNAIPLDIL
jgi:hypothetical protein